MWISIYLDYCMINKMCKRNVFTDYSFFTIQSETNFSSLGIGKILPTFDF